jgi:hypothetical protein
MMDVATTPGRNAFEFLTAMPLNGPVTSMGRVFLIGICCGLWSAGCSPGRLTEQVEGYVTLDGKPLADIRVSLQPKSQGIRHSGIGSYGLTDEKGYFRLKLSDNDSPGAVVGLHSVILSDRLAETEADAGFDLRKSRRSRIPDKYTHMPLTLEVKMGEKEVQFRLSTE